MRKTITRFLVSSRAWCCVALLLIAPGFLRAQAPSWQWATQSAPYAYNVSLSSQVTSTNGDVFVIGSFSGPRATFGNLPALTRVGTTGFTSFLGRLSGSTGQWLWVQSTDAVVRQLVATPDGGLTLLGDLRNTVVLDSFTLQQGAGNSDLLIAHCNSSGQWQSATAIPLNGRFAFAPFALAPNGDVAMGGFFNGTATFGNLPSLVAAGTTATASNVFAARFSAQAGQWQWAKQATSAGVVPGQPSLAMAPNGDVVLASGIDATIQFGSLPALTKTSYATFFVTRLSAATGQWLWAAKAAVDVYPQESLLAFSQAGDVLLVGRIGGNFTTGTIAWPNASAGNLLTANLNGSNGQWQRVNQTGGRALSLRAMAVTSTDEVIITGIVIDSIRIGNLPLLTANGIACLVAKVAANGSSWRWATLTGPIQSSGAAITMWSGRGTALSLTAADEPIVGGSVTGQVSFGSAATLVGGIAPADGGSDMFVAKLAASPLATTTPTLSAQAQLYPNPATSRFTVRLPTATTAPGSAVLLNSLGQTVRRQAVAARIQEINMDVQNLSPGIYSLLLPLGAETISRRVVVR